MSMYPHQQRMGGPQGNQARLNELLEQIRAEFDSQMRQAGEFEHQITAQVSEMQLVREKVYAMEQTHMTLKQKYEEELSVLRHQLAEATRGKGSVGQPAMSGPPQHAGPSQQPPSIAPGNGLFSGIMSGGNQTGLAPPQQQQQPPPPPHQQHGPPQEAQMGPQHQMAQGPPGLSGPPHPSAQQQQPQQQGPYQQPYPQGHMSNGMGPQPPQSTASPGPGRRPIGRPPNGVGPATPQISTPVPYPPNAQSPQINQPTPDHARMGGPRPPQTVGNALGELEPDNVAPHNKKTASDWYAIFNPQVQRVLDVDLIHSLQHDSVVCCVRFSQDGKYVATGCNRSAQIFDVTTGEKVCVLEDQSASDPMGGTDLYIRSVCFSPDGRFLATGAEDKIIRVWEIATRTIRCHFTGHEQDIYSLDFARDGRTIASGSGDRTVRLWDIDQNLNTLTLTIEDGVTTVAFSPDTQLVAAGSLDKSVRVWSIDGTLIERLEGPDGHQDSVYSVAFSPNGKDLVSGSLDKTIKMWELGAQRTGRDGPSRGGKCIKTFEGHRDFVLSVAMTPDANWVLSGSKDRGVQFWDPRTGTTQLMLQGHKNSVISVAPSPLGSYFATGSGDNKARIWSYRPI